MRRVDQMDARRAERDAYRWGAAMQAVIAETVPEDAVHRRARVGGGVIAPPPAANPPAAGRPDFWGRIMRQFGAIE
jgi:hypothetical protein